MAAKPIGGEGLSANLAGMSKNQLYDIMSQMKSLIEQNQQQARQVLIQNPMLTKALFQAQIMLGMVQPPQAVQKVQPIVLPNTQQSNVQHAPLLPGLGSQDQAVVSQTPISLRKHQNQPLAPISSAAIPAMSHQSQPMAAHSFQLPQQHKGHMAPEVASGSLPQSSQIPNIPLPSLHPIQMPTNSSRLQQPLQAPGFPHVPLQPPLPPQHRPPSSVQNFHTQYPPQTGANLGFQYGGAPHSLPQSMFHQGAKPTASVGSTFPQEQTPLPSQQSSQSSYQVGSMPLGPDFGNHAGNPPSIASGQLGSANQPRSANQPLRPQALTPDMEKALLQQVMSLAPEQINLLPPEQRNQVLQLQQMLRQ